MGDALDQVRKRLWNQARREGDKKTTGTMRGLKYALLKNPDDLTDRQNTCLCSMVLRPVERLVFSPKER